MSRKHTSRERVCFVVRKPHLDTLFRALLSSYELFAIENREFNFPDLPGMTIRKIRYVQCGLGRVVARLKLETQPPVYIPGLVSHLKSIRPHILVVFDFYHPYFLQCLHYARRSTARIYLYSETKALPSLLLSRMAMRFFLLLLRENRKQVQGIFVYSQQGYDFFKRELPEVTVRILPAPVDTAVFFPAPGKRFMDDGTLRILMNARFVAYKRHKDLLDAAGLLIKKGTPVHLTLIGRSGEASEALREEIAKRGLSERVHILPPASRGEMRALYIRHDLLVLPSYNEALGMVVPEAMACGLPTVTSDTVGANVYVSPGRTGLIHKTGAAEDLARCIELLARPEVLSSFGKEASQIISQHYSPEALKRAFVEASAKPL